MDKFIQNWNFKKHFIAVTAFYGVIKSIGTYFFMRNQYRKTVEKRSYKRSSRRRQKKELRNAMTIGYVKNMNKKQIAFYTAVSACYVVDVCSYLIIKKMKKTV